MMRFLLISSLCIFLFSCSLKTVKGLDPIATSETTIENPYFTNTSDYIYKAKIDVYGRYLGGILIIKRTGINEHRVVFTTEFGARIFDFQYEGDTFTKNFVIDDLDKKFIVKTLENDFKIVVSENSRIQKKYFSNEHLIYQAKEGKKNNFYFYDLKTKRLDRIVHASTHREKIEFVFESDSNNIAEKIRIKHHSIKLTIDLEYLK